MMVVHPHEWEWCEKYDCNSCEYSSVSINPFTDLNITFLIHDFEHVQMDRLVSSSLGLLKESSIELDEGYDTIVAPKSEFLFLEDLDEFTRLCNCTRQRFFEDI